MPFGAVLQTSDLQLPLVPQVPAGEEVDRWGGETDNGTRVECCDWHDGDQVKK